MILKKNSIVLLFLGMLIFTSGCSKSDDNQPCSTSSIALSENNICLKFEHNGLTNEYKNTIQNKLATGISTINSLMQINNLSVRIVENPNIVPSGMGIGGYNPNQEEVIIAIDLNFNDLDRTLEEDLIPLLAHEVHHAKRRRSVGYGNTLLQGAVSEGLADHFSIEVAGIEPPPWAVALTGVELQNWIDTASQTWSNPSYNHNAWFLGTDPDIPRWTGYSIGFELVKNYLLDNPNKLPSNLYNEPANSFLP